MLDYWKTNRDKMPHLASLSREIFCVPTTSASSERCFSAGGNVITDARTLLDSDRAEELIFCKQNYFALEPLIKSWKLDEEEFTSDSDDSISSLSDCPDNPGNCYINFLNLIFKKDIKIICTNYINTFLAMVLKNKIYIFSGEGKRNRKRKYNTANISGPQVKKT